MKQKKLDKTKIIKKSARDTFAHMDVRTRVVPDKKKKYTRKPKHKGREDW